MIATLAACAAVAVVGPVGFIGLMAPHVATMLGARRHRTRLWLAAACGALILGFADIAARTAVTPREVPAGAKLGSWPGSYVAFLTAHYR